MRTTISYHLLPLAEIVRVWSRYGNLNLEERSSSPSGPVKRVWWSKKWIPLMHCREGSTFCVDMDPPPNGTQGQIIQFAIETGPSSVLADSFGDWLSKFADDLEAGTYKQDQWGCIVKKSEREELDR